MLHWGLDVKLWPVICHVMEVDAMGDGLNVSLEDLLYASAVLRNRSGDIDAEHKKYHQKMADSLAGLPGAMRGAMGNKVSVFRANSGEIVTTLSVHSELFQQNAQEYQNYDII